MKNFEKQAFWGGVLKYVLPGLGGAAVLDNLSYGGDYSKEAIDMPRLVNFGLNAGLIGGGGKLIAKGMKDDNALMTMLGAQSIIGAPEKDVMLRSTGAIGKVTKSMEQNAETNKKMVEAVGKLAENTGKGNSSTNSWLIGLLGLGALGLGGYGLYKWLKKEDKSQSKMRIKLPGVKGDPNSGAEVEVPINPAKISPGLMSRINSTVLRRTRSNVRYAAKKVDPETGKKIPYEEWVMKYGDEEDREALRQELSETGDKQDEMEQMMEELAQPLPETEGDYEMKEASLIPPGFASALEKAASREGHEFLGATLASFPSSVAGALAGAMVAENNGVNPIIGRVLGGGLGAFLPSLIGGGLGALTTHRTPEEQAVHDEETPWMEYLVPGYSTYQSVKRNQAERIEKERWKEKMQALMGHASFAATGQKLPPSFKGGETTPMALPLDELVDMKKAGGMMPPGGGMPPPPAPMGGPGMPPPPPGPMGGPPPMGGPGMMGPPQQQQGNMTRPTNPGQNMPSQGLPKTQATKNVKNMVNRVGRTVEVSRLRPKNVPPPKVTLGNIHAMTGNMVQRLRNLRSMG